MRPALNLSPRVLAPAWPLLLLLGCVCETQLAHRTRAFVRRAWMAAVMLCTGMTIRCCDALVVATSVRIAGSRRVAGEEHHSNSESLVGLKARCSTKILVTSHAARSEHTLPTTACFQLTSHIHSHSSPPSPPLRPPLVRRSTVHIFIPNRQRCSSSSFCRATITTPV